METGGQRCRNSMFRDLQVLQIHGNKKNKWVRGAEGQRWPGASAVKKVQVSNWVGEEACNPIPLGDFSEEMPSFL